MIRRDAPEALLAALAVTNTATAQIVPVRETGIVTLTLHAASEAACDNRLKPTAQHSGARLRPGARVIA